MKFRKKFPQVCPDSSGTFDDSIVIETKKQNDDGIAILHQTMSASEYARVLNLPSSEVYSLANLQKAGVPLSEIPIAGVLDNNDPDSLQNIENLSVINEKIESEQITK